MADIVTENLKPGTPRSVWDAPITNQIEGFATQISVDNGQTVSFKVNLNLAQGATAPYHIEIYRLGYYGGDGATLVTTLNGLTGQAQPDPITDTRGVVDAGNWSVSASWATPADATSGVYLAKLVRDDNGATNQIPFIVRDDGGDSDIVMQTSDTTWEAYNGWSGRNGQVGPSLYGGYDQPANIAPDQAPEDQDRAFAVSYNRPFITRDGGGTYAGAQDYVFGADYSAVYWLEKNGYDVSYIAGVDTDRLGVANLTSHKAYISVGHDEYWSGDQRANVEAARDAGVNLLFWSGNEIFWKTRWENSIVDGTPYRTLVTYKETKFNYSLNAGPQDYANVDPSNQWTGTWRDTRFVDAVGPDGVTHTAQGARPENSLTGQLFVGDQAGFGGAIDVPAANAILREWRNTGIGANGASDLAPGIIGYEWDTSPVDASRPAGLIKLSSTVLNWGAVVTDQGNREPPGTAEHSLTLYRAPSGALVFGAGTVFWTWGLSDQHDASPYGANVQSTALQQFNMNILADMGVQPAATDAFLQSEGLVRASASADHIAATTTLNDLPASVSPLTTQTISGSATDADGVAANPDGHVALVEVSVDNGQTWSPAQGVGNWTFNWTPTTAGTYTVRARAIDDSLNLPVTTQLASDVVTVGGAPPAGGPVSLFGASVTPSGSVFNDNQPVELGVKFTAAQAGTITALRYFRASADAADTDQRQGHLWSSNGTLLATVNFSSAPGQSGWQIATLSTPVQIQPGVTYVASYKTADNYMAAGNYFADAVTEPSGVLSAPASGASGGNGVYAYGSATQFPAQSFNATNYWVDVVFNPAGGAASPQIGLSTASVSHPEGDSGATAFAYVVTRTGDLSAASSVGWAVSGSGANPANAADFQGNVLPSGSLSFAAGESSKTLIVSVAGDTTVEPDETFTLTLSGASGATLGAASAGGTITNDDSAPPTGGQVLTSSGPGSTLTGGTGNDTLNASQGLDTLTGGGGADVFAFGSEPWAPVHITDFTLGQDRLDLSALLRASGYTGTDPIRDGYVYLQSDGAGGTYLRYDRDAAGSSPVWPNTMIDLHNVSPTGLTWAQLTGGGSPPPASPQIAFSTASLSLAEGNSGTTAFAYTLTRTGPTTASSTVNWAVNGSGANPADAADFQGGAPPSGVVSFAAGETSKTITVNVAGDATVEPNETFTVTLSGVGGATLGTATAAGTIVNDDGPPPAGGQVLTSPGPGSTLTGGTGNDTLNASQGLDTLTGGGGADVFAFGSEPWAPIHVTDFTPGQDKLDFSALFRAAGYTGSNPVADDHIVVESDGEGGSYIRFDQDGTGPSPVWPNTIIDLERLAPAQVQASDWIIH